MTAKVETKAPKQKMTQQEFIVLVFNIKGLAFLAFIALSGNWRLLLCAIAFGYGVSLISDGIHEFFDWWDDFEWREARREVLERRKARAALCSTRVGLNQQSESLT